MKVLPETEGGRIMFVLSVLIIGITVHSVVSKSYILLQLTGISVIGFAIGLIVDWIMRGK